MLPDNIRFTSDPAGDLTDFVSKRNYSKIVVLVDDNTRKHCYPTLEKKLPQHELVQIQSGEEQKNLNTCASIWQKMTDMNLDRHGLVIVLGGGVLGDMGGFCAATYKRGVDFILIPTTLLSLVDASIGGKLGVDFNSFKNHIGVFQLPKFTLLNSGFLSTLPADELRSGFAEVIKHILISDKKMWSTISKKTLAEQDWKSLIQHSVDFKARVTTEDPKEKGLRKILNAGHTIGHALESYFISNRKPILHGEAIAIGLIAEGYIASKKRMLSKKELDDIVRYIRSIFEKVNLDEQQIREIGKLASQDKKNRDNRILCVLLDGIGQARWDIEISFDEVKDALTFYQFQT